MFSLPIPRYSAHQELHRALASQAARAEQVAIGINLMGQGFKAARRTIRKALKQNGIAEMIDRLVDQLL
jgi:hypothetical protein